MPEFAVKGLQEELTKTTTHHSGPETGAVQTTGILRATRCIWSYAWGKIIAMNPEAVRDLVPRASLAQFCKRWQITELAVFGSILRPDFRPDSDIDLLVTFAPGARWSGWDLVTIQDELGALFGRKVDLVERAAVERSENWIRRGHILTHAEPLYVEG